MAQVTFASDAVRPSKLKVRSNTFPKSTHRRPGRLGVPGRPVRAHQTPRSQTCAEFGSCLPEQLSSPETDEKYSAGLALGDNNNQSPVKTPSPLMTPSPLKTPPTAVLEGGQQSPMDQHLHWLEGKLRELNDVSDASFGAKENQSPDSIISPHTNEPGSSSIPRDHHKPAKKKLKKLPNYYCIAVQELDASSADDASPGGNNTGNNTPDWDNANNTKTSTPEDVDYASQANIDNDDASNDNHNSPEYVVDWSPTEPQMSNVTPTSPLMTILPELLVESPGSSPERLDYDVIDIIEPKLNGGQSMSTSVVPGTAVKICNEEEANAAINESGIVQSSRLEITNSGRVNGRLSTGESVSPATSSEISNSSPSPLMEQGQGFPLGLNLALSMFGEKGGDNIVGEDLWEFDGYSEGAMSTPTPGGSLTSKSVTPQDPFPHPLRIMEEEEGLGGEEGVRGGRSLPTLNIDTWSMDTSSGVPPSPVDVYYSRSSSLSRASHNPPRDQHIMRDNSREGRTSHTHSAISVASSMHSLSRPGTDSQSRSSVSPSVSRTKSWTSSKRASFKKHVLDKAKHKLRNVQLPKKGKQNILFVYLFVYLFCLCFCFVYKINVCFYNMQIDLVRM